MKYFLPLILLTVLFSCTDNENPEKETVILWVAAQKSDCTAGAGKMKCLLVHRGETLDAPEWENFYASIEGFAFEEGYLQKIEVTEEQLDPADVPADASSIKYTLAKVLEKREDRKAALNGSWVLTTIAGEALDEAVNPPTLDINLSRKRFAGSDGCNSYTVEIVNATETAIQLGAAATTKKMCPDMTVPDQYGQALEAVTNYQIEDGSLTFSDAAGQKLLTYNRP